ncbi:GGDEF domain-containing protein [Shewanella sp. 3B26]|uniref:diguanylate cyclase n=1 Tax=Shewanella zhuhaiensis TaxID=2919576 RepID=A0AAJ1BFE1_9GAMM|nr:GGDEF domain-containing protein [Shewanella zhuhaiensis]MCH4293769.1 GGDEF domain-containing protein [Shewanella zhuhaiensis]
MPPKSSATSLLPPVITLLGIVLAGLLLYREEAQDTPQYAEFIMETIPVIFWLVLMFQARLTSHLGRLYLLLLCGTALSYLGALLDWLDEVLSIAPFHPVEDVMQSAGLLLSGFGLLKLLKHQHQQNQLLQKLAGTDPLTGALNRRALVPPASAGNSVFVLMDVDHFKQINDTLGHAAGDFVLVELAKLISSQIRQSDQFFRWGGEEFLLELRDTELKEASLRIEALRALIEASHFNFAGQSIRVTISAGLAAVSQMQGGLEKAIKAADEALYRAKEAGRNQVLCA